VRHLLPKAVAAERKLRAVNSLVHVEGLVEDVNVSTIGRLLDGFDLIMDAADNFEVRYLVNDYAVKTGVPWIYGACVGSYGLTFPILPGETACLRCVFESAPPTGVSPSCDTAGVIGPIVSAIASLQAAEALKVLAGRHDRIDRRIITLDLWENRHDQIGLPPRNPGCICCGQRNFEYLEGMLGASAALLCGRNSVQVRSRDKAAVDLEDIARRLAPLGAVEKNRFLIRAVIDNYQVTVFSDGRAIIGGTSDLSVARSLYSRYVGC
jgi:molybdopterin-synthase adenylyltransferase